MLKLGTPLEPRKFRELRRLMALRHHKWDAQVGDDLALSDAPLLMSRSAWSDLAHLAEALFTETRAVEDETWRTHFGNGTRRRRWCHSGNYAGLQAELAWARGPCWAEMWGRYFASFRRNG